jgi:hypothetical protein
MRPQSAPPLRTGEEAVTKRWTQRPAGSTWGDWGDDDELGRINLLTPDAVLAGIREVLVVGKAHGQHRRVRAGAVELDPIHAEHLLGAHLRKQGVVEGAGPLHVAGADGNVTDHVGSLLCRW